MTLLQTLRRIILSSPSYTSLFRGLRADTLSTVLSSFLYFLIYTSLERIQRRMRERKGAGAKVTPAQAASAEILIGTIAGVASKRLSLPISAVCIRQQLDSASDSGGYNGYVFGTEPYSFPYHHQESSHILSRAYHIVLFRTALYCTVLY